MWRSIFAQMPSGWIATRRSPMLLLLAAVLVWSLSTALTPIAARCGLGVLFACRVVMGVAEGFCLPAIFQHFAQSLTESQRSSAFGVMLGAGSVGQLAALLICPLLPSWEGMFGLFGGLGFVWCASCACALGVATTRVPSPPAASEDDGCQLTHTASSTASSSSPKKAPSMTSVLASMLSGIESMRRPSSVGCSASVLPERLPSIC